MNGWAIELEKTKLNLFLCHFRCESHTDLCVNAGECHHHNRSIFPVGKNQQNQRQRSRVRKCAELRSSQFLTLDFYSLRSRERFVVARVRCLAFKMVQKMILFPFSIPLLHTIAMLLMPSTHIYIFLSSKTVLNSARNYAPSFPNNQRHVELT